MKNFFKKVLVMAALAMCFGFAVYIGTVNMPAVTASGSDSGENGEGTGGNEEGTGENEGGTGENGEGTGENEGGQGNDQQGGNQQGSGQQGTTTGNPSVSVTVPGNSGSIPTGACGEAPADSFNKELNGMIGGTPEGGVIRITKEDDRDSLSLDMIQKIINRDQTLVMEYTYNGADYRIVIPGKAAVIDETVPIYGPLYLAAHYSSNAAVGGSSNGVVYTIAKGDTLSKIAATNGTTVAALKALNPQIKDINVIYVGQEINLQ